MSMKYLLTLIEQIRNIYDVKYFKDDSKIILEIDITKNQIIVLESPTQQCIKVSELRKLGYESQKDWNDKEENLYVGRSCPLKVKRSDGEFDKFCLPKSK